jgi:RNA polymerase sigma-70 factor (ECF subfamily)
MSTAATATRSTPQAPRPSGKTVTPHRAEPAPENPDDLGRDEAFELYVLDHVERVKRQARSLAGNAADGDDVAQEALLRAYRGIERFDGRQPTAWLSTIVRNVHYSNWRKRRPDYFGDPEPILGVLCDEEPGPEDRVMASSRGEALAALERLTEDLRAVVELVDLSGLRYREAATRLDVPIGTVMSRLHRAREQLRREMELEQPWQASAGDDAA